MKGKAYADGHKKYNYYKILIPGMVRSEVQKFIHNNYKNIGLGLRNSLHNFTN